MRMSEVGCATHAHFTDLILITCETKKKTLEWVVGGEVDV